MTVDSATEIIEKPTKKIGENGSYFDERNKKLADEMKTVGVAAAGFFALGAADLVADSLINADKINSVVGTKIAEFLNSHGGDLAALPFFTLAGASMLYMQAYERASRQEAPLKNNLEGKVSNVFAGTPENAVRSSVLLGMSMSFFFALEEYARISTPLVSSVSRIPQGDWGDVLAFSVPFIAGTLYLSADLAKKVGSKAKEKIAQVKEHRKEVQVGP